MFDALRALRSLVITKTSTSSSSCTFRIIIKQTLRAAYLKRHLKFKSILLYLIIKIVHFYLQRSGTFVLVILLHFLFCFTTVLDDDDVALIDLMSKAEIGRENVEKGSYHAETYDQNGKHASISI